MEIERKYLVKTLPDHLEQYACKVIEQGYLNTNRSCASAAPMTITF